MRWVLPALAAAALLALAPAAQGAIPGLTGAPGTPSFSFTARAGYISTPEGNSIYMWGYASGAGQMQFPGPTLIVAEGDVVTVTLGNQLTVPVSIVFPGQTAVAATGGVPGLQTREAPPGGAVTYTFTAANPGTYTYYSGTQTDLQTEMGLVGAIIVRPTTNPATQAYDLAETEYDREYLFLMGDLDPGIHRKVEMGNIHLVDMSKRWPVYWTLNGRMAPDTMADPNVPWLPTQPYNCLPKAHPNERVLLRMVGGGRDGPPLHTHGNNHRVVARNGRLQSSTGAAVDLYTEDFTTSARPGETVDAIFVWTGVGLGWDVYGHTDPTQTGQIGAACTAPAEPGEDINDHCKPLPVILPTQQDLTFGPFFSGSAFLGTSEPLPPGDGGLNPNSALTFMWHSHNEKEIINFDIFPGGLLTMFFVEHPSVDLTGF